MGWTEYHIYNSPKQELDSLFTWSNEKFTDKVLYSCTKDFTTYYGAIERIDNITNEREVFAVVCLYHYTPRAYFNFAYKDMDETCEPYQCKAPKKLLDLLTPTTNACAIRWRRNCLDNVNNNKSLSKLKDGDIIEFVSYADFNSGIKKGDIVRLKVYTNYAHRKNFYCPSTGYRWAKNQIPKEYKIIKGNI